MRWRKQHQPRQAIAFYSTSGKKGRRDGRHGARHCSPGTRIVAHDAFVAADNVGDFLEDSVDFIVDAVDTVTTKLALASYAEKCGIALRRQHGGGEQMPSEMLAFADIYQTQSCPLCRSVRKLARKQGIEAMRVLYSSSSLLPSQRPKARCAAERTELGTLSFMPPIMGQMIAGDVIQGIVGIA